MLLMITSSCSIQSLHPLYTGESAVFEPALLGEWFDDDGIRWVVEKALKAEDNEVKQISIHDKMYLLTYYGEDRTERMEVYLVKLGNRYFLDFFPWEKYTEELGTELLVGNLLPIHTFAKVEWDDERLFVSMFDDKWLSDLIENNQIKISHEKVKIHHGNGIVLTASTKDLQKFVIKYQNDTSAFQKPDIFIKRK